MRGGAILLGLLLAGCFGPSAPDPPPAPGPLPPPEPPAYREALCDNGLLFQLVDYRDTDPHLPPGFHPRDPQGFLNTPAAFGQAGLLFMALECGSPVDGYMAAAFLAIFVEAPHVPGLEPAPFNFYELVRYGDGAELGGRLPAAGWPLAGATVAVRRDAVGGQGADVVAYVNDTAGSVASFFGAMGSPVFVGEGPVRFWHDSPAGLAYIEYQARLDALVGTGACTARAGTPLASFAGAGLAPPLACPPGEPVVASLAGLRLSAALHTLPGVHAG